MRHTVSTVKTKLKETQLKLKQQTIKFDQEQKKSDEFYAKAELYKLQARDYKAKVKLLQNAADDNDDEVSMLKAALKDAEKREMSQRKEIDDVACQLQMTTRPKQAKSLLEKLHMLCSQNDAPKL